MKIYYLIGASGAGKTTLVTNLKKKYRGDKTWQFLHFDSVGVPSVEKMIEEFGSPEGWQEDLTHKWIERIFKDFADKEVVVFEGQVQPRFIVSFMKEKGFTNYEVLLIDCSDDEMSHRLTHKRNQPDLVNQDMKNWFKFLREESGRFGIPILDTTKLSEAEVLDSFEKMFL